MILLGNPLASIGSGGPPVAGLAIIVLRGPAILVVPAAPAAPAFEFLWTRRMRSRLRERSKAFAAPTAAK